MLLITTRWPVLATRFGAEFDGLGNDATSETTTELTAKAFAPNHYKMTETLAYNSVLYEPVRISPIRITPISAALPDLINHFKIKT
jgi:hypothetical protein